MIEGSLFNARTAIKINANGGMNDSKNPIAEIVFGLLVLLLPNL